MTDVGARIVEDVQPMAMGRGRRIQVIQDVEPVAVGRGGRGIVVVAMKPKPAIEDMQAVPVGGGRRGRAISAWGGEARMSNVGLVDASGRDCDGTVDTFEVWIDSSISYVARVDTRCWFALHLGRGCAMGAAGGGNVRIHREYCMGVKTDRESRTRWTRLAMGWEVNGRSAGCNWSQALRR